MAAAFLANDARRYHLNMPSRDAPHPTAPGAGYVTPHGPLRFGERCLVMGILNVTPDSFSDGGEYHDPAAAFRRAAQMAAEGADVIDVGGESTRPGSRPVPADVQMERVLPVISGMRRAGIEIPVSIDTQSAQVAAAALDAGADIVNDISAGRHDPAMPALLARRRPVFVAMHMRGTPETMQDDPRYDDVVREVWTFFLERGQALAAAGVDVSRMIIDPGIGFGKTTTHNVALLREIRAFQGRWPVLVGPSRKRFIADLLAGAADRSVSPGDLPRDVPTPPEPRERLMGTAAIVAHCAAAGVGIVRVHDVREMRQIVEICAALRAQPTGAGDEPLTVPPRPPATGGTASPPTGPEGIRPSPRHSAASR